jgi:hypothetical protein
VIIMPEPPANNIRVFISYSHDSQEHMDRVLALSDHLRSDGINCIIDQYETSPPEGWARWCDRQIEDAEFVLVVFTGTYEQRFRGTDLTEKGKGVKWEGLIITSQLYNSQGRNRKFIPILFTQEDESHIPAFLQGFTYYIPVIEQGYESLYRHLTHQPLIEKPVLGKQKAMPLRSRLQEFHEALWHVPSHNQFFTGRKQVIERLHDALRCNGSVQVIRGLGGMGKTQTAVEYAYRYQKEYGSILWVKANSREALVSDIAALAQDTGIIDKDEKDQNLAAAAAKRWLMNSSGWLLIFDNADDPELLVDFFPFNSKGHILLTSRGKNFARLGISNQGRT